ncbi:MAG: hypothetical protein EBY86_01130, partial [Acidimicrobiia bacterium]|nr:hypothetical protein [Acidimicrobiia bacterium]
MAAPIGPYTPVVRAGDWIIVSGQLGLHEGSIVAGGVQAQTAQAIANLKSQLASVGASLGDVVKTLCFLTDLDTFATFNEAYVAGFGSHVEIDSNLAEFDYGQQDETRKEGNPGGDNPRNRGLTKRKNVHPTVKPVEIMEFCLRDVPKDVGPVLD